MKINLFLNPRLWAVTLFGFTSGLPLALASTTLQAWFTQTGVNVVTIGAITLLGIPYTFKFLWAPLLDHYRLAFLGERKAWILITQALLALGLLIIANLEPSHEAMLMGFITLAIAFFSATQDVAVDAYRTDILHTQERGLGASYYIFAYRIAMLLSGGLALVFADYWGWKTTYEIMALLMLLCMLPSLKTPNLPKVVSQETFLWSTIKQSLGEILQRDHVVLLLAFIACYKLGDAFALTLMTNFLLKGLGFTLTEVGLAYKFVYFIAAVLGAFVGGAILLRLNIYRALLWFGFAQSFSILTFLFLAWVGKNYYLMISSIFIETFCNGLSTAAFITFLMSLCDRRYSATQYALFSALAFIGRTFLGPVAGYIVLKLGWIEFYLCAFLLSLPCLLLLLPLGSRVSRYAPAPAE